MIAALRIPISRLFFAPSPPPYNKQTNKQTNKVIAIRQPQRQTRQIHNTTLLAYKDDSIRPIIHPSQFYDSISMFRIISMNREIGVMKWNRLHSFCGDAGDFAINRVL